MKQVAIFRGAPPAPGSRFRQVGAASMRIAYTRGDYPERRTIVGLCPDATYVRQPDATRQIMRAMRVARQLGWRPSPRWSFTTLHNQCRPFGRDSDVLHLFNQVSFGKGPWVSTFESIIPRYEQTLAPGSWQHAATDPDILRALGCIASPACRAIVALSRCTARLQELFLQHVPRELAQAAESKMHVLHPPQQALATSARKPEGPLRFMFVGGLFHRKGGREILSAFEKFRRDGHDLHLTIVSSIEPDDLTGDTKAELHATRARISANRDWITHHERLPNAQVLSLMQEAHVGLLPTYADTYGYSVLEFQASGCPVISTNVRAQTEINSDEVGWLIDVPRTGTGEAEHATPQQLPALSRRISAGLEMALAQILADPGSVRRKGEKALERIRTEHDPGRYAEQLLQIYGRH